MKLMIFLCFFKISGTWIKCSISKFHAVNFNIFLPYMIEVFL